MTSLQRAAAYLKKMGPKAALAIVPLALAAVPANASIVLSVGSEGYFASTGGLTSAWASSPLPGSGVQGVYGFGTSLLDYPSGTGITFYAFASGSGTGTLPDDTLGVAWDFTLERTSCIPGCPSRTPWISRSTAH